MKKHLSLLLCLLMLVSMFSIFTVQSSATAASSIVWDFTNPAAIAAVQGNDLTKCTNLLIGANRTSLSSPSDALAGSATYDADAKAVVLGAPAEKYKTSVLRPYMISTGTSFNVKDYPFVKIRFKVDTTLTNVITQIRTTGWASATLTSPTPVGEWIEKVVPLTGTGWYNSGVTIAPPSTANNAFNPSWYLQFNQTGANIDKNFKATVQYIGFFKTEAEAKAYTPGTVPTVVEMKFDNPETAWTLGGTNGVYAGTPQAGSHNGLILYDAAERSLYFTPEYSQNRNATSKYLVRANLSYPTAISGNDYRYVKLRYKIETDKYADKAVNVTIRDNSWHQNDTIMSNSPVNEWVEVLFDMGATKKWGNHTITGPAQYFRIQAQWPDTSVDVYQDEDFRFYVQYVSFFTDKATAEAYTYTPSPETEVPTGKFVVVPLNQPKYSYVLGGNRYSSTLAVVSHSFGADNYGTIAFDEKEQSIYLAASAEIDAPTQARFVIRGSQEVKGADYPYVKLCYKITNYTPSPIDWLSIRDNNWYTYALTNEALRTDEWVTLTVNMGTLVNSTKQLGATKAAWNSAVLGGEASGSAKDFRIQLWLNEGAKYNITKSEDARFYLKYVAFFQTQAEADAFNFEEWSKPAVEETDISGNLWLKVLARKYAEKYTLTATATEGGTISDIGDTQVKYKKNMTYTITAAEGYTLTDVLVDGKSVGAVTEYTFKTVKKPHTIHAVFTANAVEEGK